MDIIAVGARALLGVLEAALMLGGPEPWNEVPEHQPPYSCAELQGMTNYGEWAHATIATEPKADPVWEAKWVGYYKQVRIVIDRACREK